MPKPHAKERGLPAADPKRWTSLAPPRKNWPLMVVATLLVMAWMGFLLYLALTA